MKAFAVAALLALVVAAGQASGADATGRFALTSRAFAAGGRIPRVYTCDGSGKIVPLRWTSPPRGTRSFALLVEDPDASHGTFTHRLAWAIPGTARSLVGVAPREGINGAGKVGWVGPWPPSGTHRYVFKLYALGAQLRLGEGAELADFLAALRGKVLATATLIGRYGR